MGLSNIPHYDQPIRNILPLLLHSATLTEKGKDKKGKKKKRKHHNTDPYRLVHTPYSVSNPLVADYPTSLPATLVSDTLLCTSSSLLFSFAGCFHFSFVYSCWEWSLSYSGISRISLYRCIILAHHLHTDAHTHTRTHNYLYTLSPPLLFSSPYFFSLVIYVTGEISERCRGTGQPSPEGTVDGEPVVLRPPVNAFWFPPGLAYVIGRPSLTLYSPIGSVYPTTFSLLSSPRPILFFSGRQPPETGRSYWVRAGLSILHTFSARTQYF